MGRLTKKFGSRKGRKGKSRETPAKQDVKKETSCINASGVKVEKRPDHLSRLKMDRGRKGKGQSLRAGKSHTKSGVKHQAQKLDKTPRGKEGGRRHVVTK